MKVGVPTEIKPDEYRGRDHADRRARADRARPRGADPEGRRRAARRSPTPTTRPRAPGSSPTAEDVFAEAELVLGVKEPQPRGGRRCCARARPCSPTCTSRPAPELTAGLCESGAICVAYETVEDRQGRLPLLAPMSEIAGKIATQAGAFMLEKPLGGRGILLGGVPGVPPANVMVIGGGAVGHARRLHRDRHGGRRVRLRRLASTSSESSTSPSAAAPRRCSARPSRSRRSCPTWTW